MSRKIHGIGFGGCGQSLYGDNEWREFHRQEMEGKQRTAFERHMWGAKIKKAWLDATHDFVLFRGDVSLGRKQTMTGREAQAINRDYEDKFYNGKTPRLYRWKWIKP